MAELIAKTACADLLPLEFVGLTLTEVVEDNVTVIAPYKDQHKAVSDFLQKTHGFGLPAVNRSSGKEGGKKEGKKGGKDDDGEASVVVSIGILGLHENPGYLSVSDHRVPCGSGRAICLP